MIMTMTTWLRVTESKNVTASYVFWPSQ